jgi:hypothetical protein
VSTRNGRRLLHEGGAVVGVDRRTGTKRFICVSLVCKLELWVLQN